MFLVCNVAGIDKSTVTESGLMVARFGGREEWAVIANREGVSEIT